MKRTITTYCSQLLVEAAKGTVLLSDRITVLTVPVTTIILRAAGAKMTGSISGTLALGAAITIVAVVGLRLLAAAYLLWKEDGLSIAKLRRELDDPERQIEVSLKLYTIERRKVLSEKLSRLTALANYKAEALPQIGIDAAALLSLCVDIDALISQMSYDPPLRIAAIRLKEYCIQLMSGKSSDRETFSEQRKLIRSSEN